MGIIIVDEVPYKSKKDLKIKTTSIINDMKKTNCTEILPGSEYFSFWFSLFKRNPDKGHLNPSSFSFEPPHMKFNVGDYSDSFGYNFCISQKSSNKKADFFQCLRSTIEPQIKSFRQISLHLPCSICHCTKKYYEIDHITPFKKLYDDFTKTVDNIDISLVKISNDPNIHRLFFNLEDEYTKSLHNLWDEYHFDFAKLQKLCLECHKNKTKNC